MFNMQKMMQQAQLMQTRLQELQEKLKTVEVTGEAGGGTVRVTLTCAGVMRDIRIDDSLMAPDGGEMLEGLIVAAHNAAQDAKENHIRTETEALMAELGMPRGTKLPFG